MNIERLSSLAGAALLLCGCHFSQRLNPDCHVKQEYQLARQVSPLKVPEGLDSPNTQGSLAIPATDVVAPAPGPKDTCLDVPPKFKQAPANKAGSSG